MCYTSSKVHVAISSSLILDSVPFGRLVHCQKLSRLAALSSFFKAVHQFGVLYYNSETLVYFKLIKSVLVPVEEL